MTQKQLIELVKQHHPKMGDAQIRIYLNRALDEFCRKTRILNDVTTFSTEVDKRLYPINNIDSAINEITRVDYDGYEISRLIGRPEKSDVD